MKVPEYLTVAAVLALALVAIYLAIPLIAGAFHVAWAP